MTNVWEIVFHFLKTKETKRNGHGAKRLTWVGFVGWAAGGLAGVVVGLLEAVMVGLARLADGCVG